MSNIVRPITSLLITVIVVTILLAFTKQEISTKNEDDLRYALRVATQDATAKLVDENQLFLLGDWETQIDANNITTAAEQFKTSFRANSLSQKITDVDVSFSGVAGNWYIYGVYATGKRTPSQTYIYYKGADDLGIYDKPEHENLMFEFSLNGQFKKTNLITGEQDEIIYSIEDQDEHYFSNKVKNSTFCDIVVMSSINDFLTSYYSSTENVSVVNAGVGLGFNLSLFGRAEDSAGAINKLSSPISGPGYFAVVDYKDVYIDQVARVFAIGGAELVRTH